MSIIRQLTPEEAFETYKESLVLRVAEAAHHMVTVLKSVNEDIWNSLPPEQLVALLNANLEANSKIMQGNGELGFPANKWLDELAAAMPPGKNPFTNRAPLEIGHPNITRDAETGAFIYTPPEEPETPVEL